MPVHKAVAISTVTLAPRSINTTSPATGTAAPPAPPEVVDHVAVLFQLPPAATENRVWALDSFISPNTNTDKMNDSFNTFFNECRYWLNVLS